MCFELKTVFKLSVDSDAMSMSVSNACLNNQCKKIPGYLTENIAVE